MIIAAATLSQAEKSPRQVKLLGATVRDLGTVTAVSSTLFSCFALVTDASGHEHHRFLANLSRDEVEFPAEPQPYITHTRRVGVGLWDEMYSLVSEVPAAVRLAVAA